MKEGGDCFPLLGALLLLSMPAASSYVSAGGVAGFVEALVVHPLDMIKTRWGCSEPRASIASHVHV